jgi:hypothetical protein
MTEQPPSPESSSPVRTENEEPLPGLFRAGHVIFAAGVDQEDANLRFSASCPATTDPDEEPDPQMMKSYCDFISDDSLG